MVAELEPHDPAGWCAYDPPGWPGKTLRGAITQDVGAHRNGHGPGRCKGARVGLLQILMQSVEELASRMRTNANMLPKQDFLEHLEQWLLVGRYQGISASVRWAVEACTSWNSDGIEDKLISHRNRIRQAQEVCRDCLRCEGPSGPVPMCVDALEAWSKGKDKNKSQHKGGKSKDSSARRTRYRTPQASGLMGNAPTAESGATRNRLPEEALKGKGGSTTGAVESGASSSAALRKRSRSIGQRAGSTPRPPRGSATKCQRVVYDPGSDELVKLSAVGNTHGGFDAPVSFDAGMARSRAFSKIGRKKNAGAEASHSRGSWREEPEDLPPTKVVTNDADVPIIYGMAQMASKVTRVITQKPSWGEAVLMLAEAS